MGIRNGRMMRNMKEKERLNQTMKHESKRQEEAENIKEEGQMVKARERKPRRRE
jgi:hypothetical protein